MNKNVLFLGMMFLFMALLFATEDPIFVDSGQRLGEDHSYGISLGDLDGDGDLDAFVTSVKMIEGEEGGCKVWLNKGDGEFDGGQRLRPDLPFGHAALGDIDGDKDLDAIATAGEHNAIVFFNDGSGAFTQGTQDLENTRGEGVALCDFDNDGDLDAFIGTSGVPPDCSVLINDGDGNFSSIYQDTWTGASPQIACGDLDGDGDADVFIASGGHEIVYLNDGNGQFRRSQPDIGSCHGVGVALGDLDKDGDLDAFVVNEGRNESEEPNEPNEVWRNDGIDVGGNVLFTRVWTSEECIESRAVALKDLDGDGDLDAFVKNFNPGDRVWLNNGDGTFVDSGQVFEPEACSGGVDLGDLDGDGDIDAYVSRGGPDQVWLNTTGDYLKVSIDIKPGIEPNSINLGSNGNVPVVIFSTATFDATTVDPLTVTLAGATVRLGGKGAPMVVSEDVNRDGLIDLIVHIDTSAFQLSYGDTEAILEGQTYGGKKIRGKDTIRIIK